MLAKAIIAVDHKKVEFRDIDIGETGPWDIRVELEMSAISVGTESHVISLQTPDAVPLIPGYAPVGRVTAVGEKVSAFRSGDRVSYFTPRSSAGIRQGCGGHQSPAICNVNPQDRDLLASDAYIVKVPEGLSSDRAAFGGMAAVSCMGISMVKPAVGDRALVLGQGLIGQFAAQHLHLRGAEVAVADLHDRRLQFSKAGGADHVINTRSTDLVHAVRSLWPDGADLVVDTTGNYGVIEASVDAIRYRGKYVFLAWCKGATFNLPKFHNRVFEAYFPWTIEGQRVLSAWRLMATGALKVDHLVTHRFPAQDARKAYDMIYSTPGEYMGILFAWQ